MRLDALRRPKVQSMNSRNDRKRGRVRRNNDVKRLREILQLYGVPARIYSIGSYAEESVCIDCKNGRWMVYEGERGNKYNLRAYSSPSMACDDLISRVSENSRQERQMKSAFKKKRKNNRNIAAVEIQNEKIIHGEFNEIHRIVGAVDVRLNPNKRLRVKENSDFRSQSPVSETRALSRETSVMVRNGGE